MENGLETATCIHAVAFSCEAVFAYGIASEPTLNPKPQAAAGCFLPTAGNPKPQKLTLNPRRTLFNHNMLEA